MNPPLTSAMCSWGVLAKDSQRGGKSWVDLATACIFNRLSSSNSNRKPQQAQSLMSLRYNSRRIALPAIKHESSSYSVVKISITVLVNPNPTEHGQELVYKRRKGDTDMGLQRKVRYIRTVRLAAIADEIFFYLCDPITKGSSLNSLIPSSSMARQGSCVRSLLLTKF